MTAREFRLRSLVRLATQRREQSITIPVSLVADVLAALEDARVRLSDRESEVTRLQTQHRRLIDFKRLRGES